MNEDASAGIDDDVKLAARIPLLSTVGIGLLVAGIVGVAVAVIMLYFGIKQQGECVRLPSFFLAYLRHVTAARTFVYLLTSFIAIFSNLITSEKQMLQTLHEKEVADKYCAD